MSHCATSCSTTGDKTCHKGCDLCMMCSSCLPHNSFYGCSIWHCLSSWVRWQCGTGAPTWWYAFSFSSNIWGSLWADMWAGLSYSKFPKNMVLSSIHLHTLNGSPVSNLLFLTSECIKYHGQLGNTIGAPQSYLSVKLNAVFTYCPSLDDWWTPLGVLRMSLRDVSSFLWTLIFVI